MMAKAADTVKVFMVDVLLLIKEVGLIGNCSIVLRYFLI